MADKQQPELPFSEAGEPAENGEAIAPDEAQDSNPDDLLGASASAPEHEQGPLRRLMDDHFLQYSSYVICERAIPSLADGLKPVQRRILHSLFEKDDGRFIKVANVVGHAMQYHPHGDASIADALVNLTNKRYLIEGQGNFGNIHTGDPAAASRYIECRLTELARKEVFNKDLTRFVASYDGRNKEPVTFPAKLPLLLMLGAEGIAVGLATRIFTYNFAELLEAQIAILKKKPFTLFPDFAHGGLMDVSALDKGNGTVRLRARIVPRGAEALVITELPYGTTTESLTLSIEDAIRKNKVPIKSITDFTAENVEIELELKPGTKPAKAIQLLYAFTGCETTMTSHIVVIHKNRPVELDDQEVLRENTRQLVQTLKRELTLRRQRLIEDIHAKTLVQIFVENRIYKRIEECKTAAAVVQAVHDGLAPFRDRLQRDVTAQDVDMLLSIRIRRISLFDINKNKDEIRQVENELATVEKHLANLTAYATRYLRGLLKEYGAQYPRRTEITSFKNVEVRELTATELTLKHDKESGYIGYAVDGEPLFPCSSLDKIVVVWDDARYKVMPPPDKFFVDKSMVYCRVYDRDAVMTMVYRLDFFTHIKRFAFGGAIQNKDYQAAPADSKVLFFEEGTPEELYVSYKAAKGQRIHQQLFHPKKLAVKGVKAQGNQLTAKTVARIASAKPRWWKSETSGPRGVPM